MKSIEINENEIATNTIAKVTGFSLLFGITIVMFGQFYVSAKLIVPGNSVETAKNIIAYETQFRIWIVCNLLYITNTVVLLSVLYVMLRPMSRSLALIAAFCRFIYSIMWVVIVLNMLSTFRLLSDTAYLQVFEVGRLKAFARLNLRANTDAYYVGLPFYAFSSTIFSYLWFKSRYIPRALAVFGMIASAWCVICSFAFIALPNFDKTVNLWWFDTPMAVVFDLALGFWLLFKGIKNNERKTLPWRNVGGQ